MENEKVIENVKEIENEKDIENRKKKLEEVEDKKASVEVKGNDREDENCIKD